MEGNQTTPTIETQRYLIGECVGRGGLGSVYRAWDARLGRWVAIKRLVNPLGSSHEDLQAKVGREAAALAAFQHPNIVTVHDFGTDEEGPFVVMEFIEGATMDKVVEQAPFDLRSFLMLAEQSLAGVAAAHHAGLLHRDLKPGNIMLAWLPGGDFQVKILDFGLAKFSPQPQEQTLDQGNALFGSIWFMAPEQFRREPVDTRTDLYALGCVLYFALTGANPFTGDSVAEVMAAHLHHQVPPLAPLRPDVPEPLCDWVMRLISLSPTSRPNNAAEAAAILRGLVRASTGGSPAAASLNFAVAGTPRPQRMPAVIAGAALVLAVAGALGFHFWRGKPAPVTPTAPAARAAMVSAPSPSLAPPPAAAERTAERPTAPVATPTPGLAVPPAADSPPPLDANDLAALRAHMKQIVEVRGTPTAAGHSKSGTVLFLNFARPHEGLSLVFFVNGKSKAPDDRGAHSPGDIEPFVGHPIAVHGKISEHAGDLQIVVETLDQIKPLP